MRAHLPHIFLILFFYSCSDIPLTDSSDTSSPITIPYHNWVDVGYATCLDKSCPCECAIIYDGDKSRSRAYIFPWLRVDSVNGNLVAILYSLSIADTMKLTFLTNSSFSCKRRWSDDTLLLSYKNDTISIGYNKFICIPQFENCNAEQFSAKVNKYLFAKSINPGDTLIRSLLALDSTTLTCDTYLGNLIYAPELPEHKQWILRGENENVILYQYTGDGTMKSDMMKGDTVRVGVFAR